MTFVVDEVALEQVIVLVSSVFPAANSFHHCSKLTDSRSLRCSTVSHLLSVTGHSPRYGVDELKCRFQFRVALNEELQIISFAQHCLDAHNYSFFFKFVHRPVF